MATERQREANRRNGRKGGPKTDEGKQRSRSNSLKHGLTSSTLVVLPEEDRQEYDEVLRGFRDSLRPEDSIEEALVLRLAQAHWRSLRSRRIESGILQVSADIQRGRARQWVENSPQHLDLHEAIGVGFMADPAERWQMYLRYDTTISRGFFKTLDSLTKLQRLRQVKTRPAKPAEPEPPRPLVFTAGAGAQLSDSGIRSVSQNGTSSASATEAPTPASGLPQTVAESASATGPRASASGLPQTLNQQKKADHEPKEQKQSEPSRRTLRSDRRVTNPATHAPDRVGGKEGHLQRLLAPSGVLPRIEGRANQGNNREVGRPQKA